MTVKELEALLDRLNEAYSWKLAGVCEESDVQIAITSLQQALEKAESNLVVMLDETNSRFVLW